MQALIMLKNFITAGPPHAKHQAATKSKVQSLITCLLDELLSSFPHSDNKRQHVHIYQRALQQLAVALSGKMYKHELQLAATAITYIREQLPAHFNWNECSIHTTDPLPQFTIIATAAPPAGIDHVLVHIVGYLHQLLLDNLCTWRHLSAIDALIRLSPDNGWQNIDPLPFATSYNLYDLPVLQSFVKYFRSRVDNADTPAAELRLLLKQLNQDAIQVPHFCHEVPSLKQQLNDWLSEELFFIEATSPLPSAPSQPAQEKLPKISTSLSVAQFAAFLRLVTEANIISCSNQRQFLAFIAAHLKTSNASHISAQSFRNKYYGPETNTISVLKDVCISMLNHARKLSR